MAKTYKQYERNAMSSLPSCNYFPNVALFLINEDINETKPDGIKNL